MKIGLISDTHGNVPRTATAIELFRRHKAAAIVHCGDVGGPAVVELLGQCGLPVFMVAGNVDHADALETLARLSHITFSPRTVELPLGSGKWLVATHGHLHTLLEELLAGQQFTYVCHGHTHRWRDERIGQVRVINPGSIHQPRGGAGPTAAVLDSETDDLEMLSI